MGIIFTCFAQSLEEEEAALQELREQLKFENTTLPDGMIFAGDEEATLLRFLRARKLSIPDSLKMIKGTSASGYESRSVPGQHK